MLTRNEAHLQRNVISLEPCFAQDAKMSKLINKIFDEHEAQVNNLELELMKKSNECDALQNAVDSLEAQLKAKENDIEHQDMIIKCLSMDLDNKEKLLKAKDEEIEGLKAELHYEETAVRSIKDL